jgi:Tfp pilus assembly protein PilE
VKPDKPTLFTSPLARARRRERARAGLSLVEITLLVSVAAIVLAASAPAFLRSLRMSKVAEAPYQLLRLQERAAAYYATPHPTDAGLRTGCLPEPAGPAPAQPSETPVIVQLTAPETPGAATWQALGFELDEPIRFRYSVVPSAPGCESAARTTTTLALRAEGDLDADGTMSLFERTLIVVDGELRADPLLFVRDRTE